MKLFKERNYIKKLDVWGKSMDIIKKYLETMFMNLPSTNEVRKAKEELFSMMEDKYNELKAEGKTENEAIGIVISEFGNLEELEKELGLDGFVKEKKASIPQGRFLQLEEVKEYLHKMVQFGYQIGLGVILCICSPILLVFLSGFTETRGWADENITSAIGIITLLVMVAIAVGIFIYTGMRMEKYEFIKKNRFSLDDSIKEYVRIEKEKFQMKNTWSICIGVVLCVLSVVPVIFTGSILKSELFQAASVGSLLVMVSMGVFLFITTGMRMDSYRLLLKEKDYMEKEIENKLTGAVAGIYWPLVACIYLVWSFMTNDWGITWFVFPIAGIVFSVVAQICNMVEENKNSKKL